MLGLAKPKSGISSSLAAIYCEIRRLINEVAIPIGSSYCSSIIQRVSRDTAVDSLCMLTCPVLKRWWKGVFINDGNIILAKELFRAENRTTASR